MLADPLAAVVYAERRQAPEPIFERLLAGLAFRLGKVLRTRRSRALVSSETVASIAKCLGPGPFIDALPPLRYRLRRDGFEPELIAQCFALYQAALERRDWIAPNQAAFDAGAAMLGGAIAELAEPTARAHAIALAAVTQAIRGVPVHVVASTQARAHAIAEFLRVPLAKMGIRVSCIERAMKPGARRDAYSAHVVCASQREIGFEYLRDRLRIGRGARPLGGLIERVAGDTAGARQVVLKGLHCALVADADAVMLDDAHAPLVVAAESEPSQKRLLYEQALELARALEPSVHYELEDAGVALTPAGAQRLTQLVAPLGSVWAEPEEREQLVATALSALHLHARGEEYYVRAGQVRLGNAGDEREGDDEMLLHLLEVKEGCRLSGRQDVLARESVPRFLRSYVLLAGICADARGLEDEFWSLYRLKAAPARQAPADVAVAARVFVSSKARRAAIVDAAQASALEGHSVLIALRSASEAQALAAELESVGAKFEILRGSSDESEQQVVDGLGAGGSICLVFYPAHRNVQCTAATYLILAELHDAQRHVNEIYRAFGAKRCESFIALEDEAVAPRLGLLARRIARATPAESGELPARRALWLSRVAQRNVERAQKAARADLISRDRYLDDMLAFSGSPD